MDKAQIIIFIIFIITTAIIIMSFLFIYLTYCVVNKKKKTHDQLDLLTTQIF